MDTNSRQNWSTHNAQHAKAGADERYARAVETARQAAARAEQHAQAQAQAQQRTAGSSRDLTQNVAFGTADKPEGFVQTWKKATHTWRFRAVLCVFLALLLIMMQPTGNALYRSWNAATGEAQGLGAAFANGDGEDDGTPEVRDLVLATSSDLTGVELETQDDTTPDFLPLGANGRITYFANANSTTAPAINRYILAGNDVTYYTATGKEDGTTGARAVDATQAGNEYAASPAADYVDISYLNKSETAIQNVTTGKTTNNPASLASSGNGMYGATSVLDTVVDATGSGLTDATETSAGYTDVKVTETAASGGSLSQPFWALGYAHSFWLVAKSSILGPTGPAGIFTPEILAEKTGTSLQLRDQATSVFYWNNYTGGNSYFPLQVASTGVTSDYANYIIAETAPTVNGVIDSRLSDYTDGTAAAGAIYDHYVYSVWDPVTYNIVFKMGDDVLRSLTEVGWVKPLAYSYTTNSTGDANLDALLDDPNVSWALSDSSGSAVTGAVGGGTSSTAVAGNLFNPYDSTSAEYDPAYNSSIYKKKGATYTLASATGTTINENSAAATVVARPYYTVKFLGGLGSGESSVSTAIKNQNASTYTFLDSAGDAVTNPTSTYKVLPWLGNGWGEAVSSANYSTYLSNNYDGVGYYFLDSDAFSAFVDANYDEYIADDDYTSWSGDSGFFNDMCENAGDVCDASWGGGTYDLDAMTLARLTVSSFSSSSGGASWGATTTHSISTPANDDGAFTAPTASPAVGKAWTIVGWTPNETAAANFNPATDTASSVDGYVPCEQELFAANSSITTSTTYYAIWGYETVGGKTVKFEVDANTGTINSGTSAVSITGFPVGGTLASDIPDGQSFPTYAAASGYDDGNYTWAVYDNDDNDADITSTVLGSNTASDSAVQAVAINGNWTFKKTFGEATYTVTFAGPGDGIAKLVLDDNGTQSAVSPLTGVPINTPYADVLKMVQGDTDADGEIGTGETSAGALKLVPETGKETEFVAKYGQTSNVSEVVLADITWTPTQTTSGDSNPLGENAVTCDTTYTATATSLNYTITLNVGGLNDSASASGDNVSGTFASPFGTTPVVIAEVPYGTAYSSIYIDTSAGTTAYYKDGAEVESGTDGATTVTKYTLTDDTTKTPFATLVGSGAGGVLASGATGTLGKYAPGSSDTDMNGDAAAAKTWTAGAWESGGVWYGWKDRSDNIVTDMSTLAAGSTTVTGATVYTYTFKPGLVPVIFSKKPLEAGGYAAAKAADSNAAQYKDLSDSTLGAFGLTGTDIVAGGVNAPSSNAITIAGVEFAAPSNVEALYVPWGTASSVLKNYGDSNNGVFDGSTGFPKIVKTGDGDVTTWRTKYDVSGVDYVPATWALDTTNSTSDAASTTLPDNFTDNIYVYEGTAPLAELHVKVIVKGATDGTTTAGWLLDVNGSRRTGSNADRLVLYNNPGTGDATNGYTFTPADTQTITWGDYASVLLTDDILQGPNDGGKFQYTQANEAQGWNDDSTRAWLTAYNSQNVNPVTTQVTTDDQTFYVTVGKKDTTSVTVTINGGSVNGETGSYTITGVPVGTKLSDIVYTKTTENSSSTYAFYSTTASDVAAESTSGGVTTERKKIDGTRTADTGYIDGGSVVSEKKTLYDTEVGAVEDTDNNVTGSGWLNALEAKTAKDVTSEVTFNFPIDYYDVTITFQKPTSLTDSTTIAANGAYLNVNTETTSSTNTLTIKNVPYYIRSGNTATATTLGQIKYKADGNDWVYDASGAYTVPAQPSGVPDGLTLTGATGWQKDGVTASTSTQVFTSEADSAFTYTFALKSYTVEFVLAHGAWASTLMGGTLSDSDAKFTVSGLKYGDTLTGGAATIAAIANNSEQTGNGTIVAASGWGKSVNTTDQKVKGTWDTTPVTTISGDATTITYTFTPTQVDTITWQVQNGYFTSVAGSTYTSTDNKTSATEEVYRGDNMASVAVTNKDATVYSGPTWYQGSVAAANKVGTDGATAPSGTTSGNVTYIADFATQQITWQIVPHYQTVAAAEASNSEKSTADNWTTGTALTITSDAGTKLTASSTFTPSGASDSVTFENAIKSLGEAGYSYVDFSDEIAGKAGHNNSQTIAGYLSTTGFTPTTENKVFDMYFLRNEYTLTLTYTFDGNAAPGTGFNQSTDGFTPTWKDSGNNENNWSSPSGNSETKTLYFEEPIQDLTSSVGRMVTFTLPTNGEYAFKWQDSEGTAVSNVSTLTMPAANTTYYGRWTRANTYTVTFYNNDTNKGTIAGETNSSVSGADKEVVITGKWHDTLTAPTVTGKTYDGKNWSNMYWTAENNGETAASVPNVIGGNATFWTHYGTNTAVTYANDDSAGVNKTAWSAIDSSRLTFEGTPGRLSTDNDKFGGATGLNPADYANTGYIFDKWTVSPSLSTVNAELFDETGGTNHNQPMEEGFVIDQNYTFTATYKQDVFNITYQQTLKAVAGDQTTSLTGSPTSFSKSAGGSLTLPVLATSIDNYQFSHYEITYTGDSGTVTLDNSKVTNYNSSSAAPSVAIADLPEADITVTAVYTPVNYTVTWQFASTGDPASNNYTNAAGNALELRATTSGTTQGVAVASGGQTATLSVPYGTSYTDLAGYGTDGAWVTIPTDAKYDGIDWGITPETTTTVTGATTLNGTPQIRSYTVTVEIAQSPVVTGTLSAGDKTNRSSIDFTATYGQTVGEAQYKYNNGSSSALISGDLTINPATHYNADDYTIAVSTGTTTPSTWKADTVTGPVTYTLTLQKKRYAVTFALATPTSGVDTDAELAYTVLPNANETKYYVESGDTITMPGLVEKNSSGVSIDDKYNGLTWKSGDTTVATATAGSATATVTAGDAYSDGTATTVSDGASGTRSVVGTIALTASTSVITHGVTITSTDSSAELKPSVTSPISVGYGSNIIAAVVNATQPKVGYAQDASLVTVTVDSTNYANDGTLAMGTSDKTANVSYPKLHKVTLEIPKGTFTAATSTDKYRNTDADYQSGRVAENTNQYIELYVADGKKLEEYYTLYKFANIGNLVSGSSSFVEPVSSRTPDGYKENTGRWQTANTWANGDAITGDLKDQVITADTTFYYVYEPTDNNTATVNVYYQNATTPASSVAGTTADYHATADQTFQLTGLTFDTSVNVADLLTEVGNGTNAAEGDYTAISTANTAKKILVPVGFKKALADHSATSGVASTSTYTVNATTGTISVYLDRETLKYNYKFLGDATTPQLAGVTPPSTSDAKDNSDHLLPTTDQEARYGETVTLWTTDTSYNGTVNGTTTNMSFLGWVKDDVTATPFFSYTFDSSNITYSSGSYTPATTAFGGIWGTKVYKTTVRLLTDAELSSLNGTTLSSGLEFDSTEYDKANDAYTKLTAGGTTTSGKDGSVEVKTAANTAIAEPTHEFSTYNPNYTDKTDATAKYEILGWVAKHKATADEAMALGNGVSVGDLVWDRVDNDPAKAIQVYTATNNALGVNATEDGQEIMPIIQVKRYTVTFTGGAHGTDPNVKNGTDNGNQYGTQFTLKYGDPLPYSPVFADTANLAQNVIAKGSGTTVTDEYGFDSNGYVTAKSTEEARVWKTPDGVGTGTGTRTNWEIVGDANQKNVIGASNAARTGAVSYNGTETTDVFVGGDVDISWKWAEKYYTIYFKNVDDSSMQKLAGKAWSGNSGATSNTNASLQVSTKITYNESIFKNLLVSQYAVGDSHTSSSASVIMSDGTTETVTISQLTDDTSKSQQLPSSFTQLFDSTYNPTKPNATFEGWVAGTESGQQQATPIKGRDVTVKDLYSASFGGSATNQTTLYVYATWQGNPSRIVFHTNFSGGANTGKGMSSLTAGTHTTTDVAVGEEAALPAVSTMPAAFSPAGYDFTGWVTSDNNITGYSTDSDYYADRANFTPTEAYDSTAGTGGHELFAVYAPHTYQVRWMKLDGSSYVSNKEVYEKYKDALSGGTVQEVSAGRYEATYTVAANTNGLNMSTITFIGTTNNPVAEDTPYTQVFTYNQGSAFPEMGGLTGEVAGTTEFRAWLYGNITINTATFTGAGLIGDGATLTTLTTDSYTGDSFITLKAQPKTLVKLTLDDNNQKTNSTENITIDLDEDLTDTDGDGVKDAYVITRNTPTKSGYDFGGWKIGSDVYYSTKDKDGNDNSANLPSGAKTAIPKSVLLNGASGTGQWTEGSASYTVEYYFEQTAGAKDYWTYTETGSGNTGDKARVETDLATNGVLGRAASDATTVGKVLRTADKYSYVMLQSKNNLTIQADGSTTVKLYYTLNSYTATFNFWGQTFKPNPQKIQVVQGEKLTIPKPGDGTMDALPAGSGLNANDCWLVGTTANTVNCGDEVELTGNVTYNMVLLPNTHYVTFEAGDNAKWSDGTTDAVRTVADVAEGSGVGDKLPAVEGTASTGYAFIGWTLSTRASESDNWVVTSNVYTNDEVKAYAINDDNVKFTASYKPVNTITYSPGLHAANGFGRAVASFDSINDGWTYTADGAKRVVSNAETATDIRLGQMDADKLVTEIGSEYFDANGDPVAATGYTFKEWADETGKTYAHLSNIYSTGTDGGPTSGSHTFTATYEPTEQTVTFVATPNSDNKPGPKNAYKLGIKGKTATAVVTGTGADNTTNATAPTTGTTAEAPAGPAAADGYEFDYWQKDGGSAADTLKPGDTITFPAQDATYTAVYKPIEVTISFTTADASQGTVSDTVAMPDEVTVPSAGYDSTGTAIAAPQNKALPALGYHFSAWTPSTAIAGFNSDSSWYDATASIMSGTGPNPAYGLLTVQKVGGLYTANTYTASFERAKYKATFTNPDDSKGTIEVTTQLGSAVSPAQQELYYGDKVTYGLADTAKTGYEFKGWTYVMQEEYLDASGNLAIREVKQDTPISTADVKNTAILGDTEFTAVFDKQQVQIAFDSNSGNKASGSAVAAITGESGQADVTLPACTWQWAGHTFKGWSKNVAYEKYDASASPAQVLYEPGAKVSMPEEGADTYYAVWEVHEVTVTYHNSATDEAVTWYNDNGSSEEVTTYKFKAVKRDVPKTAVASTETAAESPADVFSDDAVDGNTWGAPGYISPYADKLKIPGYAREFLGWTDTPGGQVLITPGDLTIPASMMPTAATTATADNNLDLYAVWADKTYTITLNPGTAGSLANGVTANDLVIGDKTKDPTTATITYGTTVEIPAASTKFTYDSGEEDGYNYKGWSDNASPKVVWTKESPSGTAFNDTASYVFRASGDVTLTAEWEAKNVANAKLAVTFTNINPSGTLTPSPYQGLMKKDKPLADGKHEVTDPAYTLGGWYVARPISNTVDLGDDMAQYKVSEDATLGDILLKYYSEKGTPGRVSLEGTLNYNNSEAPAYVKADGSFTDAYYDAVNNSTDGYVTIPLYRYQAIEQYTIKYLTDGYEPGAEDYSADKNGAAMTDQTAKASDWATTTLADSGYAYDGYEFVGWVKAEATRTYGSDSGKYSTTWALPSGFSTIQNDLTFTNGVATVGSGTNAVKVFAPGYTLQNQRDLLTETESNQNIAEVHLIAVWKAVPTNAVTYVLAYDGDGAADTDDAAYVFDSINTGLTWNNGDQTSHVGTLVYPGAKIDNTTYGTAPAPDTSAYPVEGYATYQFVGWNTKADGTGVWLDGTATEGHLPLPFTGASASSSDIASGFATVKQVVEAMRGLDTPQEPEAIVDGNGAATGAYKLTLYAQWSNQGRIIEYYGPDVKLKKGAADVADADADYEVVSEAVTILKNHQKVKADSTVDTSGIEDTAAVVGQVRANDLVVKGKKADGWTILNNDRKVTQADVGGTMTTTVPEARYLGAAGWVSKLRADFTDRTYNVTFKNDTIAAVDGHAAPTITDNVDKTGIKWEESLYANDVADPTAEGYVFGGYTVTTPQAGKVRTVAQGATVKATAEDMLAADDTSLSPDDVVDQADDVYGTDDAAGTATQPKTYTLNAVWSPQTYTLTFNAGVADFKSGGKTATATGTWYDTGILFDEESMNHSGYKDVKWYFDIDGDGVKDSDDKLAWSDASKDPSVGDLAAAYKAAYSTSTATATMGQTVNLVAEWTETTVPIVFTVSDTTRGQVSYGGTEANQFSFDVGTMTGNIVEGNTTASITSKSVTAVAKEGYLVDGWYLNGEKVVAGATIDLSKVTVDDDTIKLLGPNGTGAYVEAEYEARMVGDPATKVGVTFHFQGTEKDSWPTAEVTNSASAPTTLEASGGQVKLTNIEASEFGSKTDEVISKVKLYSTAVGKLAFTVSGDNPALKGFTYDDSRTADLTVTADGEAVGDLYFNRTAADLHFKTYVEGGGAATPRAPETRENVLYQHVETLPAAADAPTAPAGYKFDGWYEADAQGKPTGSAITSFTMTLEDATIVGKYIPESVTATMLGVYTVKDDGTVSNKISESSIASLDPYAGTTVSNVPYGSTLYDQKWFVELKPATGSSDMRGYQGAGQQSLGTISYADTQYITWVYTVQGDDTTYTTNDPTGVELKGDTTFYAVSSKAAVVIYTPGDHGKFTASLNDKTRYEGIDVNEDGQYASPYALRDYAFKGDVTAEPEGDAGWKFAGWHVRYIGSDHETIIDSTGSDPYTTTALYNEFDKLYHSITVTAAWEPGESGLSFNLDAPAAAGTSIAWGTHVDSTTGNEVTNDPSGTYKTDQEIPLPTITATTADDQGWELTKWVATIDGVEYEYAPGSTFKMPAADTDATTELKAVWTEKYVTVQYKATDAAMGSVSVGSEQIGVYTGRVKGTSDVTVGSTATAGANYAFVQWHEGSPTGDVPEGVSTDGKTVVPQKVDGKYVAATYYAEFTGKQYDVKLSVNPASVYPVDAGADLAGKPLGYIKDVKNDKAWESADGQAIVKVAYGQSVDLGVIDGVPNEGEAYADGKYWTWTMYEGQDAATGTATTGQVDRAGLASLPIKGYTELVVSFKHPVGDYMAEFWNTADGETWAREFSQRYSWSDSVSTQRTVERTGYDFKGWYIDVPPTPAKDAESATDYEAKPGNVQLAGQKFSVLAGGEYYDGTSNIVLRAGWQMREGYAVNFDANGGSFTGGGAATTVTTVERTAAGDKIAWSGANSAVPAAAEPTWAGHEFLGWYTQPVGGDRVYVDASGTALSAMDYSDIVEAVYGTTKGHDGVGDHPTLYARWQETQYQVVYFAKWGDSNEYEYTTTRTFTIDQTGLNISAPSNSDENWRWAGEWRYGADPVEASAENTAAVWAAASAHVIDGSSTIRKIESVLDSSDTSFAKKTYYAYGSFEGKKYITTEYQLWDGTSAANASDLGYANDDLKVVDRAWAGDVVTPNVSKEIPGFVFGASAEAKAKTVELNKDALSLADGATYDDVKKTVDGDFTFQVAYYARGGYTLKFNLNDTWSYGADALQHAASLVKTDPSTGDETIVTDANIDAEMMQTGKTFLTNDNVPYIEVTVGTNTVRFYDETRGGYSDPERPGFEFGGWNAVQIDDASHTNEGVAGFAPADPGNNGSDTLYGWLARNADGTRFDPINNPDSALTLFAKWTELRRDVAYVVASDPELDGVLQIKLARDDDGWDVVPLTETIGAASGDTFDASGNRVISDSKIGANAKVVRRGYSFTGWRVVGEDGREYKEERGEAMGDAVVETASALVTAATRAVPSLDGADGADEVGVEADGFEFDFDVALSTAADSDDVPSVLASQGTAYTPNEHVTAGVTTDDGLFAGEGSDDDDSPLVVYVATAALNDKQQITYDKGEADTYTGITRATQPTGTYFGEQPVVQNGVEKWGVANEGSLPASSTISREGYSFNGWKANVDLTYDIVDASGNVTGQGVVKAGEVINPSSAIAKRLIVPETAVVFTPDWTRGTQQRLVNVPEATDPDTGEVVPGTTIQIEDGGYLTDDQIAEIVKRGDKYPDTWDVTTYVDGQPVTKTMTVDELIKYLQENPVTSDMTIAVNPNAKWSTTAPTIPPRAATVRPAKDRAVKTGDMLPILPIAGTAIAAALVLTFLLLLRRRRE